MMKTPMIALTALLALGTTAAIAQTAAPATAVTEVDDTAMIQPWNVSADQLEDLDVFNPQGVKLGEVEEVVGPNATEGTDLIIDFSETATGDDQDRIVPFDALTYIDNTLTLPADADMMSFATIDD